MKQKKIKLCTMFILCLGLNGLKAQDAIPATGGNASGSGGSESYTVGQIIYNSNIGTNGSESRGVQQPFEISVVTGFEEVKGITLQCLVYPNPASDFVTLKLDNCKTEDLTYQIYDINGKLLKNKIIDGIETTILMKNFVPATYFLKVFQNHIEIKTFKIIKNY
jgi:hypothetical protein